jgi:hypothetical protein
MLAGCKRSAVSYGAANSLVKSKWPHDRQIVKLFQTCLSSRAEGQHVCQKQKQSVVGAAKLKQKTVGPERMFCGHISIRFLCFRRKNCSKGFLKAFL